jgi:hypothetical protein
MNSLKHGVLARALAPPGDLRRQDRLYWQIERELMGEYRPTTFSQRAKIGRLATLHLQYARCRQLIEAVQRPVVRDNRGLDTLQENVAERDEYAQLKRILLRLEANEPLTCHPKAGAASG